MQTELEKKLQQLLDLENWKIQQLLVVEEVKKLSWICDNIQRKVSEMKFGITLTYTSYFSPSQDTFFNEETWGNIWSMSDEDGFEDLQLFSLRILSDHFEIVMHMNENGIAWWKTHVGGNSSPIMFDSLKEISENRNRLFNCYLLITDTPYLFNEDGIEEFQRGCDKDLKAGISREEILIGIIMKGDYWKKLFAEETGLAF